jgi:uncharacterized protein
MQISLELPSTGYFIRSYSPGSVTVNTSTYSSSIIIHGDKLITDWPPQTFSAITEAHLQQLLSHHPEVILLGTGSKQQFLSHELSYPILRAGIGIESMDSMAACRTYNILASESRNVLLALLLK